MIGVRPYTAARHDQLDDLAASALFVVQNPEFVTGLTTYGTNYEAVTEYVPEHGLGSVVLKIAVQQAEKQYPNVNLWFAKHLKVGDETVYPLIQQMVMLSNYMNRQHHYRCTIDTKQWIVNRGFWENPLNMGVYFAAEDMGLPQTERTRQQAAAERCFDEDTALSEDRCARLTGMLSRFQISDFRPVRNS